DEFVLDFDKFKESLEKFTLEYAEEHTRLAEETMIEIAESIIEADTTAVMRAIDITQHSGGSDASTAISNLLLATGNYRKPGASSYPLRGHNNVQGASDMGSIPDRFTRYQKVTDEAVREKFSKYWNK